LYTAGYFLTTLVSVINSLLTIYGYIIVVRALLTWVRPDPNNSIMRLLSALVDPVTNRLSRIIPTRVGMIDFSAIILLAVVWLIKAFLVKVVLGSPLL